MTYFTTKTIIAIGIFLLVNLFGGIALGLGYTAIHYRYKREINPAFNWIFKIVTPILITIALAVIFYKCNLHEWNRDIWISVVGAWVIRFAYIYIWQRNKLMNMAIFFTQVLISSLLSFWLYTELYSNPTLLFPSRDNMVSELWLIIMLFLYKALDDLKLGEDTSSARKKSYIMDSFNRLNQKYGPLISKLSNSKELELLTYSIAIVENFNRPRVSRLLERLISAFRKQGTYGIMQIKSHKNLSDSESLQLGIQHLNTLYIKVRNASDINRPKYIDDSNHVLRIIERVAWHYNNSPKYSEEVSYIFQLIQKSLSSKPSQPNPLDLFNAYFHRPQ
jgi:hypothetical protein